MTGPLRNLIKTNHPWAWRSEQESAFENTKNALSADTTLAYFDLQRESQLAIDASPTSLGVVLAQKQDCGERAPIALASRTLTATEQRYTQIERKPSPSTGGVGTFTSICTSRRSQW
ncbi:hypothetical protein NDU88_006446 [Pleurodeles waltl]|uniref:Reverse transcriptase/retrotransposon-derived protein RNase H-like domain-containing protein n=1 Tax=Pleurodeles waltl TaxID=8319 RepID=A0AAV7QHZ4_PLEWA|nr:hypothetical protein NDU88_006446 [Pleurodeles waltl]